MYGAFWGHERDGDRLASEDSAPSLDSLPGVIRQTLCWEVLAVLAEAATLAVFND